MGSAVTKILLVSKLHRFASGANTIAKYVQSARTLGHEVAVFGKESGEFPAVEYSLDVERFDFAVFVVNEATDFPDLPDLARLLDGMPKDRRIIIDCCGRYNDTVRVDHDVNHLAKLDGHQGWEWVESFQTVADSILQPTLTPLKADVRPFLFHAFDPSAVDSTAGGARSIGRRVRTFLFHGYNPKWEQPLDFGAKPYGVVYVGSNWFRWQGLKRVLEAVEPIRAAVGRMMIAGDGWQEMPSWVDQPLRDDAYFTDPGYLRGLGVELRPSVPIEEVVSTMSLGVLNPVLVRPIFNHLRLLTPRLFETAAANTIPLFNLDAEYVAEIYGPDAVELVLGEDGSEQIVDIIRRPSYYAEIVREMRRHLAERHSFRARVQELVDICEEMRASR
jgi:glycosyltransferase involved in cell wall biosynthesis